MTSIKTSIGILFSFASIGWIYQDPEEATQVLTTDWTVIKEISTEVSTEVIPPNAVATISTAIYDTVTAAPQQAVYYVKKSAQSVIDATVKTGTKLALSGAKMVTKKALETGQEVFEEEVGVSVETVKCAVMTIMAVTAFAYLYSKLSASNNPTKPEKPTIVVNVNNICPANSNKKTDGKMTFFQAATQVTAVKIKNEVLADAAKQASDERGRAAGLLL
ncbi:MAG: hypothetical protein K0U24_02340 [Gammaproteobacteria bacterium]|nr:hypothetical protein [Gammaproteobacteria bacterium]